MLWHQLGECQRTWQTGLINTKPRPTPTVTTWRYWLTTSGLFERRTPPSAAFALTASSTSMSILPPMILKPGSRCSSSWLCTGTSNSWMLTCTNLSNILRPSLDSPPSPSTLPNMKINCLLQRPREWTFPLTFMLTFPLILQSQMSCWKREGYLKIQKMLTALQNDQNCRWGWFFYWVAVCWGCFIYSGSKNCPNVCLLYKDTCITQCWHNIFSIHFKSCDLSQKWWVNKINKMVTHWGSFLTLHF